MLRQLDRARIAVVAVSVHPHHDALVLFRARAGDEHARTLDLAAALRALREREIATVLCEGGPTLAGRLLAGGLVQRVVWLLAPRFLRTETAVPALNGGGGVLPAFSGPFTAGAGRVLTFQSVTGGVACAVS